ncbi:DUF5689 domain-containing protein [Flammeovirga pacifica]|nr:DUF5689 domain-containing protein [Flammeovirga pacifica]
MKTQTFNKFLQLLLIGGLLTSAFFSCTKDNEPDGPGENPENPGDITVNATIEDVINMYESNKESDDDFFQITEEMTFVGTVISSDETGNVYKYITVQDEKGHGIQVKLNASDLYTSFPQGRKVAIKTEDMYIGNYGGLVQLGGLYNDALGSLEEDMISSHVFLVEGEAAMPTPTTLDLDNLPENISALYNTMVTVTGVQFAQEGVTYADQENNATNLDLVNKNNLSIILRTSKYSSFADDVVPSKSGSITAILTAFNSDLQLTLVSTEDVKFNDDRFEIEINLDGEGTLESPYSIADVKKLGTGEGVWVKGYIVGSIDGASIESGFIPGATDKSSFSNLVLADVANITDGTLGIPVQLSSGTDVRDALNLNDNPENAQKEVWIFGNIEDYFRVPGLKETTKFSWDGESEEEVPEPDPDHDGIGEDITSSELTNTSVDFSTFTVNSFTGWSADGGKAFINAYGKGKTEAWMISKEKFTLEGTSLNNPRLVILEELNYFSKFDDVQVLVSSDYDGMGDPTTATWTVLTSENDRSQFGEQTLNYTFTGSQYVAFKYSAENGTSDGSSYWSVSTVKVDEKYEEELPPEVTPGENILLNGDFENWTDDKPDYWTIESETGLETTIVQNGDNALKVTATTGTRKIKNSAAVKPNTSYKLTVWYHVLTSKDNANTSFRMWSSIKNGSGETVDTIQEYFNDETKDQWIQYEHSFETGADAETFLFEVRTYKEGTVIYDNIELKEVI